MNLVNKEIEAAVHELDNLQGQLSELKAAQRESCFAEFDKIQKLVAQIHLLQHELGYHQSLLREKDPDTAKDLLDAETRVKDLQEHIRRLIRDLPAEALSDGLKLSFGNVRIVVNRSEPVVVYDAAGLLRELPELADMRLDDDPVVRMGIDAPVMERLVEMGVVDAKIAEQYRTVARGRTPGISFKETNDGG